MLEEDNNENCNFQTWQFRKSRQLQLELCQLLVLQKNFSLLQWNFFLQNRPEIFDVYSVYEKCVWEFF